MNNLGGQLKKFLSNKNTVTIVGIILGVLVLYFGYTMRVNKAVEPVKVPYALTTIQPKTEIKEDMIGYMNVARSAIKDTVVISKEKIIEKYSNINTMIPAGSMFYKDALITKEELPDSALIDIPDGETLYQLPVNMSTTYTNLIMPGNYIDIYIQTSALDDTDNTKTTTTTKSTKKVMIGKFLSDIKILAVKTSDGKNVFDKTDETRTPAYIQFSVPEKTHLLLRKAAYLGKVGYANMEIIPVPKAKKGDTSETITSTITSTYLENYIEERSKYVPLDELNKNETTTDVTTENTQDGEK